MVFLCSILVNVYDYMGVKLDLSYWFQSKIGPKRFLAVFADGNTLAYDLLTREGYTKALEIKDPIGVVTLVLLNGKWEGRIESNTLTNGYMPEKADNPHELVPIMLAKWNKSRQDWSEIETNPLALLEFMLKRHDWFYSYSDDHRVWSSGTKSIDNINALMKQVDSDNALELWKKYAPVQCGGEATT